MNNYLVIVKANVPYPKDWDYRIEASNHATAAARALRNWRKALNGKRVGGAVALAIQKI